MAISLQEAVAVARKLSGDGCILDKLIKYGPLTEGCARMYEFRWVDVSSGINDGEVCTLLIAEDTGENMASSSFSSLPPGDYEVLDFDGRVVRSREEVRVAWDKSEKMQMELEARAEAERDDSVEPVPVVWDGSKKKFL